jgi:hypothetical protein
MKQFFDWLARFLNGCGEATTSAQVADQFRLLFEAVIPSLVRRGWPVPETDEGKSVCMDLLGITKW